MSQAYYFKIPVFLTEGTTPRYVVVNFDGAEVANATVEATSSTSPYMFEFIAEKETGIYTLEVSVPEKVEIWSCVVVDDIWISQDNVNWKSLCVNGVTNNAPDPSYGFDPAKGAHLFGEEESCAWNISLVSAEDWDSTYSDFNQMFPARTDEELAIMYGADLKRIADFKEARALYLARGYS